MAKVLPLPKMLALAQQAFNAYIRERDRDDGCICCGRPVEDAGHFKSQGAHSSVRFDEQNVNGQCVTCNQYKGGNLDVYKAKLIMKWGVVHYHRIEQDCRKSKKWTREELAFIINHYKNLKSELCR
jgi:hypothetical protein